MPVWKTIAQEHRPVGEAVTYVFDISIHDGFHNRAHRIMPKGSNGRHVGRLALVSLIAKVTAQPLQRPYLSWFEKFS